MKKITILFIALLSFGNIKSQNAEADKILGMWLTGSGKAHVKITTYGESKFGGKIVWLKEPNRADGSVKKDDKNPDENKRKNNILGMDNLLGFTYAGKKSYEGGTIYDPENGKTYKCIMTLENENTLKVRGYIGITMIGRTDTWTRVVDK
ncbi:MAG: DUF2147 domain-containing protein [Sphingobacteriaceae bacterium]|nr:DUF2147 domain-containing protein [Sphingobacteriaceae bacterium]